MGTTSEAGLGPVPEASLCSGTTKVMALLRPTVHTAGEDLGGQDSGGLEVE